MCILYSYSQRIVYIVELRLKICMRGIILKKSSLSTFSLWNLTNMYYWLVYSLKKSWFVKKKKKNHAGEYSISWGVRIVAPIAKNTKNYIYIVFKPIIIQFYYNKNIFPRNRLLSSSQNIFFCPCFDVVVVVAVVIIILILTLILQVYGWPFAGTSGGGTGAGGQTELQT